MADERITEKVNSDGEVVERTIERAEPEAKQSSGGSGVFWGLLAAVAIVFVIYLLFFQQGEEQAAQDSAIANAEAQIESATLGPSNTVAVEIDTVTTEQ